MGLLVKRQKVLPASIMYAREHSFNRVSDLAQFGIVIDPPGHSSPVAEITYEEGDWAWIDDDFAVARVLEELGNEGLLRPQQVAQEPRLLRPHAYPVYRLGYEEQLARCLDYLEGLDSTDQRRLPGTLPIRQRPRGPEDGPGGSLASL